MTKKGLFNRGFNIPKKGNKYKNEKVEFVLNKIIQK